MSQKFNVGDRVRAVDIRGTLGLDTDTLYTIEFVTSYGGINLEGHYYTFAPDRFKLFCKAPLHSSSGGPYVCISVYNELKKQNEELKADLEHMRRNYGNRYIELTDLQTENTKLNTVVDVELQKIRDRLDVLEEVWRVKPVETHPPEKLFPDGLEGKYVAMDGDGGWYWYEKEPTPKEAANLWSANGGKCNYIPPSIYTNFMKTYNRQSWESSLHQIKKAST